jgi:hypothetical protein
MRGGEVGHSYQDPMYNQNITKSFKSKISPVNICARNLNESK